MRSGKLDRLVSIERMTNTVDDFGTPVEVWAEYTFLRAQRIQQSTDETINGGAVDQEVIVFRTRWQDGVTTADRAVFDGQQFNIKTVKELGRRDGLELAVARVE